MENNNSTNKVIYKEIECKSALNKIKTNKYPFTYSLNVYRGCVHSCPYCYARYTHWYLGYEKPEDYDNIIFVKANIDKVLEKELSKPCWKKELVSLGTATDSFQPIEKKYQLTRKCLELFSKYNTPIIFSTKSSLVIRDVDILKKIQNNAYVITALTFTTLNEKLRKIIEPKASSVNRRIETLRILKENGIIVGIHLLPIMKYVNDSRESISQIVKLASKYNIDFFIYGGFNLSSDIVRKRFLKEICKYNPSIYLKYKISLAKNEVENGFAPDYKTIVKEEMKKHSFNPSSIKDIITNLMNEKNKKNVSSKESQLSLF